MEQEAKKIYRKYKTECNLVSFGFIAAALCLLLFGLYIPAVAVFGAYIIFMRRWSSKRYEKHILSLLFTSLDGKKYKAVISCDKHIKAQWEYLYACMYAGDYDEVVSFCNAALERKLPDNVKCVLYIHLAKAYFETDAKEDLRRVCVDYRNFVDASPSRDQLLGGFDQMEIYENYLNGDYERALARNEERSEPEAEYTYALNNSCVLLYKALLVFRSGDAEQATPLFEQITEAYPLLAAGDIAKRHLAFINGEADSPNLSQAFADPALTGEMRGAYKRLMRNRRIGQIALIVCMLAALILTVVFTPEQQPEESTAALLGDILNL